MVLDIIAEAAAIGAAPTRIMPSAPAPATTPAGTTANARSSPGTRPARRGTPAGSGAAAPWPGAPSAAMESAAGAGTSADAQLAVFHTRGKNEGHAAALQAVNHWLAAATLE